MLLLLIAFFALVLAVFFLGFSLLEWPEATDGTERFLLAAVAFCGFFEAATAAAMIFIFLL